MTRRLLLLVVAAVSPLAGCLQGNSRMARVISVGDSLTLQSATAIHAALDPTYDDHIVSGDGFRIDQILSTFTKTLTDDAPVHEVVENLGTNDALQNYAWQAGWTQLIADVANVPCVILVTVNVLADNYGHGTVAASINGAIAALVAGSPTKYRAIDWNAYVATGGPAYPMLHTDLIHPTQAGQQWIAGQYRTAVGACHA